MTADHNETLKRQAKQVQRSVLIAELRSEQSRLSGLYVGKTCGVAANILAADMKEIEQLEATIVRLNNSLLDALTTLTELKQQKPVMLYSGRCTIDCGDSGHQDVTMLKMIAAGANLYLAAGAQVVEVPPGWKLVPVNPTEAMCEAVMWHVLNDKTGRDIVSAALLAAPQPPQG